MNRRNTAITTIATWLAIASTLALMSCAERTDEAETTSAVVSPWTAPRLKWILFTVPGTAKLARRDFTTGAVNVLQTHAFATHWRAVSVAGNKLLWQRTDTGQVSLWTIDGAGNFQRNVFLTPPGPGFQAASIALSDDGACPGMELAFRTYVITFEGAAQIVGGKLQKPAPVLWTVDDSGTILSTDTLPNANNLFAAIRDFRPEKFGRWSLLTVPTSASLLAGSVSYYDHTTGSWLRLRTDSYSATGGLASCTLDTLPPPLVNPASCATNFVDSGPGSGFDLSSFQLAQDVTSNNMANNLLWTRNDGTAQVFALDALGPQTTAPTSLVSGLSGFRAVSLAAFDDSSGFPLVCDHRPPPPPGASR